MLTAFCVDYVVVSKLKLTVQKYQSINENRVFRLVCKNLILNLILPTTTFFQYGNTSKKKQAFSVWDFQKFRLTPISEGGFGISSLPENIGSGHPLNQQWNSVCLWKGYGTYFQHSPLNSRALVNHEPTMTTASPNIHQTAAVVSNWQALLVLFEIERKKSVWTQRERKLSPASCTGRVDWNGKSLRNYVDVVRYVL